MSNITVDNIKSFSSDHNYSGAQKEEDQEDFKHHQQQQQKLQAQDGHDDDDDDDELAHGSINSGGGPSTTTTISTNSSSSKQPPPPPLAKKKRSLPGTPDPSADVIALSPTTLMATNRFVCEICNKGFQRDQNLQLHRRGHNLPWKLKQRTNNEVIKRVYICPETTCIHHNPARALGDLTGIKKHFSRKHGEKKWKCEKCSKKYAVPSDWKAHSKTCGTKDYKCDCGTIFSRRDSFITHRAFCDALAEGTTCKKLPKHEPLMAEAVDQAGNLQDLQNISEFISNNTINTSINHISALINNTNTDDDDVIRNPLNSSSSLLSHDLMSMPLKPLNMVRSMFSSSSMNTTLFNGGIPSSCFKDSSNGTTNDDHLTTESPAHMSATALLQKAAQMGATASNFNNISSVVQKHGSFMPSSSSAMSGIDIGGGFTNQAHFLQNPPNQISSSHFFNTSASAEDSVMSNIEMLNGIFMDSDHHQNHQFLKNMEQNVHNDTSSTSMLLMQGRTVNPELGMNRSASNGGTRNPIGQSSFRNMNNNGGSGDVTTLDFLGIGGPNSPNLHENKHHHHQHQEMRRMLDFDHHQQQQQQQLSQKQNHEMLMEKHVWDV